MDEASMDQNAGTGREAEHGYSEKAKARKSGPSLLRKSEELADKANVFAAAIYWEPTHKCHRIAARLPEGETLPDLNKLVCSCLDTGVRRLSWKNTTKSRNRSPMRWPGVYQSPLRSLRKRKYLPGHVRMRPEQVGGLPRHNKYSNHYDVAPECTKQGVQTRSATMCTRSEETVKARGKQRLPMAAAAAAAAAAGAPAVTSAATVASTPSSSGLLLAQTMKVPFIANPTWVVLLSQVEALEALPIVPLQAQWRLRQWRAPRKYSNSLLRQWISSTRHFTMTLVWT